MKYKKEKAKSPNHEGRSSPILSTSPNNTRARPRTSLGRTTDATVERLLSHSAFVQNQFAAQALSHGNRPQYTQQWNASPSYSNQYHPSYARSDALLDVHSSYVPQINNSNYCIDNTNFSSEDTSKTVSYQPYFKQESPTADQFHDVRNDFTYATQGNISWDTCTPNNLTSL